MRLCGEGKLELTESVRELQKVSAPQSRALRALEAMKRQTLITPNLPLFLSFHRADRDQPMVCLACIIHDGSSRKRAAAYPRLQQALMNNAG